MKITTLFFLTIFFAISTSISIAQTAANTALTNAGIVEMHKSGLSKDIIITSIETSVCKFNVTPTGLVALKKAGIDEEVIKTMIEKQSALAPSKSTGASASDKKTTGSSARTEKALTLNLINHVYHSSSPTDVQPLEKSVAGIRTKQGAFSASILWQVDGPSSGIRLKSDAITSFLINTGSDVLPELVLYKLNVVKGKREVAMTKASTFGGVKTGEDVLTLDISKLGNGIYKITPGKKLVAGEYFFTGKPAQGSSSAEAFAFGID